MKTFVNRFAFSCISNHSILKNKRLKEKNLLLKLAALMRSQKRLPNIFQKNVSKCHLQGSVSLKVN